jgi:hypothetical protein
MGSVAFKPLEREVEYSGGPFLNTKRRSDTSENDFAVPYCKSEYF